MDSMPLRLLATTCVCVFHVLFSPCVLEGRGVGTDTMSLHLLPTRRESSDSFVILVFLKGGERALTQRRLAWLARGLRVLLFYFCHGL